MHIALESAKQFAKHDQFTAAAECAGLVIAAWKEKRIVPDLGRIGAVAPWFWSCSGTDVLC